MLPRIDKKRDDSLFAKRLGGLQPVQTLNEYEARAVRPDQDRRLQTLVENAGRDLVYSFLFEGRTTLDRNVDVSDWDDLRFIMSTKACQPQLRLISDYLGSRAERRKPA